MTAPLLRPARLLAAAAALLTRTPLVGRLSLPDDDVAGSAVFFPVVGAAVGALVGGAALVQVELGVPVLLAAAVAVGTDVVITGALHLDGLADSADGLAGRTAEDALAIMRDHSIGAYGTAAVALDLLLKAAALASGLSLAEVVAVYAVARAAPLPLAAALRYARPDGTGRVLVDRLGWAGAAAGLAVAAGIAIACIGGLAVPVLALLAVTVFAVGVAARRRIGGVTGDVLGAAVELTTVAGLFAVAAAA
ncbi:MAG: adenosylcobinamide-GDP ribazoletransferase [Jiangellaceae bacterium]